MPAETKTAIQKALQELVREGEIVLLSDPRINMMEWPFSPKEKKPASDPISETARLVEASGDSAENGLEGMLLMFRSGLVTPRQFFPHFLRSSIFILLEEMGDTSHPMFLQGNDGTPRLVLFPDAIRAKPLQEKHLSYRYVAQVRCGDVVAGMAGNTGLVVNPLAEAVTLQMDSGQCERLRREFLKP